MCGSIEKWKRICLIIDTLPSENRSASVHRRMRFYRTADALLLIYRYKTNVKQFIMSG